MGWRLGLHLVRRPCLRSHFRRFVVRSSCGMGSADLLGHLLLPGSDGDGLERLRSWLRLSASHRLLHPLGESALRLCSESRWSPDRRLSSPLLERLQRSILLRLLMQRLMRERRLRHGLDGSGRRIHWLQRLQRQLLGLLERCRAHLLRALGSLGLGLRLLVRHLLRERHGTLARRCGRIRLLHPLDGLERLHLRLSRSLQNADARRLHRRTEGLDGCGGEGGQRGDAGLSGLSFAASGSGCGTALLSRRQFLAPLAGAVDLRSGLLGLCWGCIHRSGPSRLLFESSRMGNAERVQQILFGGVLRILRFRRRGCRSTASRRADANGSEQIVKGDQIFIRARHGSPIVRERIMPSEHSRRRTKPGQRASGAP